MGFHCCVALSNYTYYRPLSFVVSIAVAAVAHPTVPVSVLPMENSCAVYI